MKAGVVRAASLGLALLVAKLALVTLRTWDLGGLGQLSTPWAAPALLHDGALLVALSLFVEAIRATLQRMTGRDRPARVIGLVYALVVAYAAINVPVARLFSTPLTYAMTRAVGGAISDSIAGQVTLGNAAAVAAVFASWLLAQRLLARAPATRLYGGVALALGALFAAGPTALERVETAGLHRDPIVTLLRTTWRAWTAPAPPPPAWLDEALPAEGPALDLTHLSAVARGRSVVVVVLESTGARYLSPWGAERDVTPNLTRLVERGVTFDHAYAAYPESIKGFFSYLCATWPVAHTDAATYAHERVPAECIGERFAAAGYHTGLFHSGRFVYLGMEDIVRDRGFDVALDAGGVGGRFASSFGTDDAETARSVLAWVDELPPGEPFLAMYMPIAGHHPYRSPGEGPRPFPETTEYQAYLNDLHAGDHALGALVDGMAARGHADDLLWVVFGDHGEAFHQHAGNFAHSLFVYEENLHVPLAFVLPGRVAAGVRAPQVASLIDVLPTTLELAGLPRSARHQGRSLLAPDPGLAAAYTDHGVWQMALRQGRWKLILDVEADRARLFDLEADPGEREDFAPQNRDRVTRYKRWLDGWHRHQHDRIMRYREVIGAPGP